MPSVRSIAAVAVLVATAVAPQVRAQATTADERPARDYRIGIEDVLRVFIWGEADLSERVIVRPDGKITVPLVNDLEVVGLTTDQVRERIAAALAKFIREPTVSVIVEQINSYRLYFIGEVNKQGAMNFFRPIRLLQAIAAAGGPTQFASKEIVLLREENGVERRMVVNYKRLIAGEPGEDNIYLQAGDTLLFR